MRIRIRIRNPAPTIDWNMVFQTLVSYFQFEFGFCQMVKLTSNRILNFIDLVSVPEHFGTNPAQDAVIFVSDLSYFFLKVRYMYIILQR